MSEKFSAPVLHGAAQKVVERILPALQPHLALIEALRPEMVWDDECYKRSVVAPALTGVAARAGGVTAMVPRFSDRFTRAMFNLRDELVVVDRGRATLAEDFQQRLHAVLVDGMVK